MKRLYLLIFCLIVVYWGLGCQNRNIQNVDSEASGEEMIKLVVYLSAPTHTFLSYDENGQEIYTNIYPSRQVIGSMITGGDVNSPNANIIENAIQKYALEANIEIEVKYLEEFSDDGEVLQNIVNNNEKLPDALIMNKTPHYDYYRLAEQGYLLDFTEYYSNDEAITDAEKYYSEVLDGGIMFNKRYAIPILFNLNGLITTSSYLNRMDRISIPANVTYTWILDLLRDSCVEVKDDIYTAAIYETSGYRGNGRYIPSILIGSAYPQYFDETSCNLTVTSDFFSSIFYTMELYNQQEFAAIANWEENTYIENMLNNQTKTVRLLRSENVDENFGIFLSGGRSGGASFYNSLLTDLAYYQTVYEELEEDLVFIGIPTLGSEENYAANISLAAFGLADTEYPEEVYKLIRYLMDYEYPTQYGFSVNKEITKKQVETIQSSVISIYPHSIWNGVNSIKTQEELKSEIKYTDPLKSEYADAITYMLDNIAGAGLPYGILEYYMFDTMNNLVGDGKLTSQEAGNWIVRQLEQYIDDRNNLEAFYDENFINSISLLGDLPQNE